MSDVACICGDAACTLPLCPCGEWHASSGERCRDCDIQHGLDSMQCSVCQRMRYRRDHEQLTAFAGYLWGDACECDPRPPSVADARTVGSP